MTTGSRRAQRGLLICLAMAAALAGCTRQKLVESTPKSRTATPVPLPTKTAPQATMVPTSTVTPLVTSVPTATPPSEQGMSLSPATAKEESEQDRFVLEVNAPHLEGASGSIADAFNREVEALIGETVTGFKLSAREVAASGMATEQRSYLNVGYDVAGVVNGVLSVQIDVDSYSAGAAHPGHRTEVLNYVLATGRLVSLSELFRSGSNYLQVIADYCVLDLKRRDALVFEEGALPTPQAYRNWNLQTGGLLITFDEYQVAPYAAGPQTVLIPYSVLRDILDPAGPLAPFIR
jgi:hypothetical protein